MRLVVLESPFAGEVEENVKYAKECMKDCLHRDEAPIASHLLWTQPGLLDDNVPGERVLGIEAGLSWHSVADAVVFYVDRGVSGGMLNAMKRAAKVGIPTEIRSIR